jgi:DNA-binding transcriptional MocR family regulator
VPVRACRASGARRRPGLRNRAIDAQQLLDQISREALRPWERLGAERDLALSLGVSRSTVRQALAALQDAGVVRRVPGRGGVGNYLASDTHDVLLAQGLYRVRVLREPAGRPADTVRFHPQPSVGVSTIRCASALSPEARLFSADSPVQYARDVG